MITFRLTLIMVLLAYATYAKSCSDCRPPVQIAMCPDFHCYRCGPNEELNIDSLRCECKPGFYRINGFCGICPDGYYYDALTQWCIGINPCGLNQILVNGVCQCLPGLQVIQNICQGCPINQTYFPEFDACRCAIGFLNLTGICTEANCTTNQIFDDATQTCICGFGYVNISGVCGICPSNLRYEASNQSCVPVIENNCKLHQYWFGCCCFCEIGYVRIRGECNRCPIHSSYNWNLDACVCDPGFYFVGELVKRLPYASQDSGSSFITNPAYIYSAFGPSTGSNTQTSAILTTFSNYDQNGVNTNGPNFGNSYVVFGQNAGNQAHSGVSGASFGGN